MVSLPDLFQFPSYPSSFYSSFSYTLSPHNIKETNSCYSTKFIQIPIVNFNWVTKHIFILNGKYVCSLNHKILNMRIVPLLFEYIMMIHAPIRPYHRIKKWRKFKFLWDDPLPLSATYSLRFLSFCVHETLHSITTNKSQNRDRINLICINVELRGIKKELKRIRLRPWLSRWFNKWVHSVPIKAIL